MLRQIAMILPIFLAGVVLGAWALAPDDDAARSSIPDKARDFDHAADYQRLEQMISSLTEILNLEVAERRRLEEKMAVLTDQVAALADQKLSRNQLTPDQAKQLAVSNASLRTRSNVTTADVNVDRFIDAGFPPDVAARLKREMDQLALDRLYLRDQAIREGWLGTPRYRDELRALNGRQGNPREDLSAEDYDRYLYAMGRSNRIVISSVLTGSPASDSGLRAGDAVLSYDGTRVFSPAEIRRATSGGSAGAVVPVEILRDGQRQIVYLPRGPLGVNMSAISAKP